MERPLDVGAAIELLDDGTSAISTVSLSGICAVAGHKVPSLALSQLRPSMGSN